MSVLIFIDTAEGHVKKASLEALSYGAKLAGQLGTVAEGVVLGSSSEDLSVLGKYGVKKIHHVNNNVLDHLDAQLYSKVIGEVVGASGSKVIVFINSDGPPAVRSLTSEWRWAISPDWMNASARCVINFLQLTTKPCDETTSELHTASTFGPVP